MPLSREQMVANALHASRNRGKTLERTLNYLADHPGATTKEISKALGRKVALDAYENRGHITKIRDESAPHTNQWYLPEDAPRPKPKPTVTGIAKSTADAVTQELERVGLEHGTEAAFDHLLGLAVGKPVKPEGIVDVDEAEVAEPVSPQPDPRTRHQRVVELLAKTPGQSRRQLNEALGLSADSTKLALSRWVKLGTIQVRYRGIAGYYYPANYAFKGSEGSERSPWGSGNTPTVSGLEQLAKEYLWDANVPVDEARAIKAFIEWVDAHEALKAAESLPDE